MSATGTLTTPPPAQGIDVSHWQRVTDWGAVQSAGNSFVGIKATDGLQGTDPTLREHREGFRQQPFVLGIYYHFARSGSAVKQAERFLDAVGRLRDHERLALDFEVPVTQRKEDAIEWLDDFLDPLAKAYPDRRPIIYTSRRVWRQVGNPAWERAKDVDLWVPRYSENEPELPDPWVGKGWVFWQFSESAEVPGIEGPCDANVFCGDALELHRYAGLISRS